MSAGRLEKEKNATKLLFDFRSAVIINFFFNFSFSFFLGGGLGGEGRGHVNYFGI